MPAPEAAAAFDLRQRALAAAVANAVDRQWSRFGPAEAWDQIWATVGPRILDLVAAGQLAAATDAGTYVSQVLPQVGLPDDPIGQVVAGSFAGVAGDGRDLETLLYQPVVTARDAGGGPAGLQTGRAQLRTIVLTQLGDAAREAAQVGLVARPRVKGYVRMVTPPSCARCAILAGRWYRWSAGFDRHPRCDCRHIPVDEDRAGDVRTDVQALFASGQVHGLSKAAARAIADGADPSQVVNASRGMATAQVGGRRVQVTTEGTTRHGYASHVRRSIDQQRGQATPETSRNVGRRGAVANYPQRRLAKPRLMPSEIYRTAGSRDEALRLLVSNGFVLPARGQSIRQLAATVA